MKPPFLKTKIFIVILGIFLIFSLNFYQKEVKNFLYSISFPIQKVFWHTGGLISDSFEIVFGSGNLIKENEKLKLDNQKLLSEIILLKKLEEENKTLREALEIGLHEDFELVFIEAISKDILEDSILINKGSKDGISEGFSVITQHKVLVGKVKEVFKDFSKVMLISNKDSSFDAEILESEVLGIVKGRGNFALYLDFVPQEKEIKKEDLVITAASKGVFPQGLLVGQISKIIKSNVKVFQQAEIKPAFDIKNLKNLFIIVDIK